MFIVCEIGDDLTQRKRFKKYQKATMDTLSRQLSGASKKKSKRIPSG